MRSKEVEEAINQAKKYLEEPITTITEEKTGCTKIKTKFHIPSERNIETLLSYIKELEKENKFLRGENNIYKNETVSKKRIRDKIKELKEEFEANNSSDVYRSDYYIASEKYAFCEEKLKELLEKGE